MKVLNIKRRGCNLYGLVYIQPKPKSTRTSHNKSQLVYSVFGYKSLKVYQNKPKQVLKGIKDLTLFIKLIWVRGG